MWLPQQFVGQPHLLLCGLRDYLTGEIMNLNV